MQGTGMCIMGSALQIGFRANNSHVRILLENLQQKVGDIKNEMGKSAMVVNKDFILTSAKRLSTIDTFVSLYYGSWRLSS